VIHGQKNQGQTTISWRTSALSVSDGIAHGIEQCGRKAARRRVRRVRWPCIRAIRLPGKPVRMVVGFAAGGISDVLGRAVAINLSRQLGQQVIVENKPGAGTTIAGDFIVKSRPTATTSGCRTSHAAINTALYAKLPYDSIKDFTYIAMIASRRDAGVHPTTPAHNVRG